MPVSVMRLDKLLTNAGLATRSQAKRLVREGRVTVEGLVATDAAMRCEADGDVRLDGARVYWRQYRYFMLNKPAGYLSATADARDATVLDLLPEDYRKLDLFPAGRLDKDSEGLLILTNDGDYCHTVISPKSEIRKEYEITVAQPFPPDAEQAFRRGLVLDGGFCCKTAELLPDAARTRATVVITEGKYHQVKRMALAVGVSVTYLKRVAIGGLRLDPSLKIGEYRELSGEDLKKVTCH